MNRYFLTILLVISPLVAKAGENNNSSVLPLSLKHKASIEIGTGIGTGNIDNQNYSVAGKLISTHENYTNQLKANFADIEKKNNKNENLYNVNNKLKYDIDGTNYALGELEFVNNDAVGIDRRTSETVGLGRNIFTKDNLNIAAEASAGARQSSYKSGLSDESSVLGKVGTIIDWEVYDNVNLNNDTYMAFTQDNTQTVSDTSVKTFVYDNVYVKGGVNVENNHHTPTGVKKTDTVSSINLGYQF